MSKAQLIKLVAIASCLWVEQPQLAQAEQMMSISSSSNNTCQITKFVAGDLLTASNLATSLNGQLSIDLNCQGNASGNLLLTFRSPIGNDGHTKIQLVNSSGVLAGTNTNTSATTMVIKINSQGNQNGHGQLQIEIAAPNGKLLKSANDYKVLVTAEFINN